MGSWLQSVVVLLGLATLAAVTCCRAAASPGGRGVLAIGSIALAAAAGITVARHTGTFQGVATIAGLCVVATFVAPVVCLAVGGVRPTLQVTPADWVAGSLPWLLSGFTATVANLATDGVPPAARVTLLALLAGLLVVSWVTADA